MGFALIIFDGSPTPARSDCYHKDHNDTCYTKSSLCKINMDYEYDDSIFSEDVVEKLEEVALEYNVWREDDDNDVSEEETSTENDSDDEALYDDGDLAFDFPDGDISERSKFEAFITEPCGCKLTENEKPRSSTIPKEEFIGCRNNCMKLTSSELDMLLLGTVHSSINCSDNSVSGRLETARKRTS